MTSKITRAALAAFMVAASPLALSLHAWAQDAYPTLTEPPKLGDRSHDAPAKPKGAGPVPSAKVNTALNKAQKDATAQKLPDALADAKDALAASTTDYDKVASNMFIMNYSHQLKDDATAATAAMAAADAAATVADLPPDTQQSVYTNATIFAINSKQNAKAATYAKHLMALNLTDARSQQIIGQALYLGGDAAGTIAFAKQQIAAATAAGQRPPRDTLNLLLNAQSKAQDEAGAEDTMERMIEYYNDPNDWQQLINVVITAPNLRDQDYIYLGRLLFVLGVKVNPENATAVGQTASHLGYFGDAQNAAANGATPGSFADPSAKITADKATLPQQIAAEQSQNGLYSVKLAEALYSYGMYPQAETAAALAQSKGGLADPSEAGIVLGEAQVAQGKYQQAIDTFSKVSGGGPATPRIVRLWTTFARNKMNPPGATAAAH